MRNNDGLMEHDDDDTKMYYTHAIYLLPPYEAKTTIRKCDNRVRENNNKHNTRRRCDERIYSKWHRLVFVFLVAK